MMFSKYKKDYILAKQIMYFYKRGIGSFYLPPVVSPKTNELKDCFIKEVDSYCQNCEVTGYHTSECPVSTRSLPTLPPNY
uniref:CCHC-type domain-containing protein n=1 Tax=Arundo donax TaxID=35708 RepID=A0A0A9A1D6_ARUDO